MFNTDCYCVKDWTCPNTFVKEKEGAKKRKQVVRHTTTCISSDSLFRDLSKDFVCDIKKIKSYDYIRWNKTDEKTLKAFLSGYPYSSITKKNNDVEAENFSSLYKYLNVWKKNPYVENTLLSYKEALKRKISDFNVKIVSEKKQKLEVFLPKKICDRNLDISTNFKKTEPSAQQKLKKVALFEVICEKAEEGFNNYKNLKKILNHPVGEFEFSNVEPLVRILMNLGELFESLKFVFSNESSEVKFIKNQTSFSFEYFYDTKDSVIMSALKNGKYRAREFRKNEYAIIREYVDVL